MVFYLQKIEERNRLIKENKIALAAKEQEIRKDKELIDQLENENEQDYATLLRELSETQTSSEISFIVSAIKFDWNPSYNLDTFRKLLTGQIPRTPISIFTIELDNFKSAFLLDVPVKGKINCKDLKLFTNILFGLMREGILLIDERLLEQAIMDCCLHRGRPVNKANLQTYTSDCRCNGISHAAEDIVAYLNQRGKLNLG